MTRELPHKPRQRALLATSPAIIAISGLVGVMQWGEPGMLAGVLVAGWTIVFVVAWVQAADYGTNPR